MINIKRIELEHAYNMLNKLANKKYNSKFTYFVIKNLMVLKSEIQCINKFKEAMVPGEKLLEYAREENIINSKYIHVDNNNNPIVYKDDNGTIQPYCGERKDSYNKEIVELKEIYKIPLKQFNDEKESIAALMEDSINIDAHIIDYIDLPIDSFTGNELIILYKFINMEEDK